MSVFYVDIPDEWLGEPRIPVLYKFKEEREGLWHKIARPFDHYAIDRLRACYGGSDVIVRGYPDWWCDPPDTWRCFVHEDRLLVLQDGPLDTAHWYVRSDGPKAIRLSIRDAECRKSVTYEWDGASSQAYFVSMEAWQRDAQPTPEWGAHNIRRFQSNLAWRAEQAARRAAGLPEL